MHSNVAPIEAVYFCSPAAGLSFECFDAVVPVVDRHVLLSTVLLPKPCGRVVTAPRLKWVLSAAGQGDDSESAKIKSWS